MELLSNTLFASDFYQIKHWSYQFEKSNHDAYNDCMCVVFVKRGHLGFDLSKTRFELHSGHILFDKPDYQFRFLPALGACSIFNFQDGFYTRFLEDMGLKHAFFFSNPQLLSLRLLSTPELDFLHHHLIQKATTAGKLEMDSLILDFLHQVVRVITNRAEIVELSNGLKNNHLRTIEQAKEYMNQHFAADISLQEISNHCLVSPFHFSRIFKKFTAIPPHQYLQGIRLKHGELLLKNTTRPVSEIAYASGFNSLEYFATAFRQKYRMSPSQFRSAPAPAFPKTTPAP